MEAHGEGIHWSDFESDDCPSLAVNDWNDYIVYVLLCPETKIVRYVGSTRQARSRKQCHTRQIHAVPKTPVEAWTTQMVSAGTPPIFRVVCHVRATGHLRPEREVRRIERALIKDFARQGKSLLNVQVYNP